MSIWRYIYIYIFSLTSIFIFRSHNDDFLQLNISKMNYHDFDKLFLQNKMYNFHCHSFGLSASIFYDQNIFQTYKYSNLITASVAGPFQNRMVMWFQNRYCLHDHTLIYLTTSKAQFSLATSKAQFSLATSKAQFSLATSKAQFSLATSKAQFSLATSKAQANYLALFHQSPS